MFKSALSQSTCLFVVVVFTTPVERAASQSMPVHVQQPLPGHPRPGSLGEHQPHQPPCRQQAGISKSAVEDARRMVEAVGGASWLTPQQGQQKIRQIHEQAKQEMDALGGKPEPEIDH